MNDKPETRPPIVRLPLSDSASATAPFFYFEEVTAFGHLHGVIRVTLEATRLIPAPDNRVETERVIVGHLRMNIPAALSLKAALEGALLLATPTETGSRN